MMLDVNFVALREGFMRYLPVGIIVAVIMFAELFFVLNTSVASGDVVALNGVSLATKATNTEVLGQVLYTQYLYPFETSGLILLVAMIGAIVLTLRHREGVRKQSVHRQVTRKREESVQVISVDTGRGV